METPNSPSILLRTLLLLSLSSLLALDSSAQEGERRKRRGRAGGQPTASEPRPAPDVPKPVQGEPSKPERPTPARTDKSLEGVWEGYYFQNATPAGMRVTLREESDAGAPRSREEAWARDILLRRRARALTLAQGAPDARPPVPYPLQYKGELAFYPLELPGLPPGRAPRGPEGSYEVVLEMNAASGAFQMTPGAWIQKPRNLANGLFFAGLFDPQEGALFGSVASNPGADAEFSFPVVLWRPESASARVEQMAGIVGDMASGMLPDTAALMALQQKFTTELQTIQEQLRSLPADDAEGRRLVQEQMAAVQKTYIEDMRRAQTGEGVSPVTFEEFLAWFEQADRQHEELITDENPFLPTLYAAQPLLSDELFAPAFGKRIDELENAERTGLVRTIIEGRKNQVADRNLSLSISVLIDALGPNYALVIGRENVQRRLRAYYERQLAGLPGKRPTAEAFADLDAVEEAGLLHLRSLWSEEQEALRVALDETRRRLADDVIVARARRSAAAAEGPEAALQLSTWHERQAKLSAYASPQAWNEARAIVDRRLDALLAVELEGFLARLSTLGEGFGAVTAGVAWFRELEGTFGFAWSRPGVREAIAQLAGRRPADLERATPELEQRLSALDSVPAVDDFVSRLLCVPGDLDSPAGAALRAAANRRRMTVARELFLARFSPREQGLMREDGTLELPATVAEPPTGEEIRLAYLREIEWLGGKMLDHQSAQVAMPGFNLLGLYNDVRIDSVVVLRTKAQGVRAFYCEYDIDLHMSMGENIAAVLTDDTFQGQFAQGMLDLANESGPHRVVDLFVLTDTGWRSPSFRERGLESIADFYETVTESVQAAAEIFGF